MEAVLATTRPNEKATQPRLPRTSTMADDLKKYDTTEPDIVAQVIPSGQGNEPPIPAGHARFYCSKCHTPYDLPNQATSWRCANCMEFNSITKGECEWCSIL